MPIIIYNIKNSKDFEIEVYDKKTARYVATLRGAIVYESATDVPGMVVVDFPEDSGVSTFALQYAERLVQKKQGKLRKEEKVEEGEDAKQYAPALKVHI